MFHQMSHYLPPIALYIKLFTVNYIKLSHIFTIINL